MKTELISKISSKVGYESRSILLQNAEKYDLFIEPKDTGIRFRIASDKSSSENVVFGNNNTFDSSSTIWPTIKTVLIILVSIGFLWLLAEFISDKFDLRLIVSFLVELVFFILVFFLLVGFKLLTKSIYNFFESKYNNISVEKNASKYDYNDDVYKIISDTYETLSEFRKERERQAKYSYNAALSLIITGVLIVFLGVLLLFRKSIAEGSITAGVGAISNIIGGTILKFYKDTNNRMDNLNNDLFTLNSAKVQYALILKISDTTQRDTELSKLVSSIGGIKDTKGIVFGNKNTGSNIVYSK